MQIPFKAGQKVRYIGNGFPDRAVVRGDVGIYIGPDDETRKILAAIENLTGPFPPNSEAGRAAAELATTIAVDHGRAGIRKGTCKSWVAVDDDRDKDRDKPASDTLDQTPGSWDEVVKSLGFDPRKIEEKA